MKKALLILDMLNTFDFPEGEMLARKAFKISKNISKLKKRCHKKKIPIIYVNDNFGQWRSDWKNIYDLCSKQNSESSRIAQILKPDSNDYFVLKPKHSAFYSTCLEPLLQDLGVKTLILTGVAGNICVLFTAHDAHMRDYKIIVPRDCTASNDSKDERYLERQLKEVLKISTSPSSSIRF